ncbi:MAG: sugar ABC transporter permease [Hyphomicrobiales bacterium]|nr:sugar ABC transporter permease [Hyphomicrobiales bacterium]
MASIDLVRSHKVRGGFERISRAVGIDPRLFGMLLILATIWIILNLATGGNFLTARNLFNLSLQVAVVGVMATGMVLVIVSRNIDLSVGSIIGFVGVFGALVQTEFLGLGHGYTWWVTSLLMLMVGTLIGAGQGAIIAYGGVPSFIVTLGGLLLFRNAAFQINMGATVAPLDETFKLIGGGLDGTIGAFWSWVCGVAAVAAIVFTTFHVRRKRQRFRFAVRPLYMDFVAIVLWSGLVLLFVGVMNSYLRPKTEVPMGIAIPMLILIGVTLIMTVIARKTSFGRYVYAIGGNPESADLAGISVKWTIVKVFAVMGFLAGLASIIVTARLNAGASVTGTLTELNVIAAAVIGGSSLTGGIGTIYGAVIGAVFMQSLENGMVLLGVPTPMQKMVIAIVLVGAVWIDRIYQRSRS